MQFYNQVLTKKIQLNPNIDLTVIQDTSPFHFGTKLRKAIGIYKSLSQRNISTIVLQGNANSNYMACFSTYFRFQKFQVYSVLYSHSSYKNLNYWVTIKNSNKVLTVNSKQEFRNILESLNSTNHPVIPPFGICKESLLEIFSLWKEMDWTHHKNFLLEVGSGLTLLSLLHYLEIHCIDNIRILAVCIGRKKERMIQELKELSTSILRKELDFSNVTFIDPCLNPKFGNYSSTLINYSKNLISEKIFLEPVYSAKSLYTLESLVEQKKLELGKFTYLHQGGILPFYRFFL